MAQQNYIHYFSSGVAEAEQSWGCACSMLSVQVIQSGAGYPQEGHPDRYRLSRTEGRRLDEYRLVYIAEGKGWFESEHQLRREVGRGDVIVLFPAEWHNLSPDPYTGWTELQAGFRGRDIDSKVEQGVLRREQPVVSLGGESMIPDFFEEMRRVSHKEESGYQYELSGILMHLIGMLTTRFVVEKREEERLSPFITRAKSMMRERIGGGNGGKNVSPEDIAAELGIGYTRFRRAFKEQTGISPAQYQLEIRFIRAKQLLQDKEKSIGDIAFELGFANQHQFSTFFRLHEGTTPSEWRKTI